MDVKIIESCEMGCLSVQLKCLLW